MIRLLIKAIVFSTLFILFLTPSWAKNHFNPPATINQIDVIKDSLENVTRTESRLLKIVGVQNGKDSILKIDMNTAQELIATQNSLINDFRYYMASLALIIPIISLMVYFFSVKPVISRTERVQGRIDEQIERLEKKTDKFDETITKTKISFEKEIRDQLDNARIDFKNRIEDSLKRIKEDTINKALANLKNSNIDIRQRALGTLRDIPQHDFLDEQNEKISDLLCDESIDDDLKESLVEIFARDRNIRSDGYFTKIGIHSSDDKIRYQTIKYFMNFGMSDYLEVITDKIIKSEKQYEDYIDIIGDIGSDRNDVIAKLLNYKPLQSNMKHEERTKLIEYLLNDENWPYDKKLVKETFLCKEYTPS